MADETKIEVPGVGSFTLEELKERVLKAEDYTKKTQAVSEERKAIDKMKSELDQRSLSLSGVQELADALADKPEFADKVRELADKYNNPDGTQPTEGTAKADALQAELKKLTNRLDEISKKEADKENEIKTRDAFEMINNRISDAIKKTGEELTDRQKKLVGNDAWAFSAELAQKGLLTDEAVNAYVKEGVEAIKDPKLSKIIAGVKKSDNTPTGGAVGTGGTQTPPEKVPTLGTKEYTNHWKNIFLKNKPTT